MQVCDVQYGADIATDTLEEMGVIPMTNNETNVLLFASSGYHCSRLYKYTMSTVQKSVVSENSLPFCAVRFTGHVGL